MGLFVVAWRSARQKDAAAGGEVGAVARSMTRGRWTIAEAGLAAAAFGVLSVLVMRASLYLPEPDDFACRASVVAMTHGHFFTLSGAQARALADQVDRPRFGRHVLAVVVDVSISELVR